MDAVTAQANFWQDRRVFVTGATGLLGSWLTQELVEKGADVVCLTRDHVPSSKLHGDGSFQKVTCVHGCLEDYFTLERTINEYEVESVFHLGAQTIVGVANRNPLSTFEANIRGTYHILEACRRAGRCPDIVVASSDKAYGNNPKLPYEEIDPPSGEHPYDVSKSCADLLSRAYHATYKIPVCVTRCGNFYGGGDLNWNRLIPGVIRWGLRGERPLIRSDGKMIRDYFYVREAVSAYLMLAERMSGDASIHGEAFNFSNELQIPVIEMSKKVLGLLGRPDLEPVVLDQATNEIPHQYLSTRKAREMLSWSPAWEFDEALTETIDWYRGHLAHPR